MDWRIRWQKIIVELIDVNSDVKDRVMEVSHIQSLIYMLLEENR